MKQALGRYEPYNYFQLMEVSLRELLVEKGIVTDDAIEGAMRTMRERGPERGAAMVALAWTDPAYKARLLENGPTAIAETKAWALQSAWGGFDAATMDALVESHAAKRRTEEAAEGLASFAEKRAARWKP